MLGWQSFAEHHPGVAFTHASPGAVRTRGAAASPSLLIRAILPPLLAVIGKSPDACGEFLTSALLRNGEGAHLVNEKGDDIPLRPTITNAETRAKVWAHSIEATRTVKERVDERGPGTTSPHEAVVLV
jgi:hypothetical protein